MSGCCCTTTTVGPNVCPDGYEPCGADSIWSWGLLDPLGQLICSWVLADPCPQGCDSYPPSQAPPPCENGFQVNSPGLCCKPATTTTSTTPCFCPQRIEYLWTPTGELNGNCSGFWTPFGQCGEGCRNPTELLPNRPPCTDPCGVCWIFLSCICA